MNMEVEISNLYIINTSERHEIVIEMQVKKPREWEVVARLDAQDVITFLKWVLRPSIVWAGILLLLKNR